MEEAGTGCIDSFVPTDARKQGSQELGNVLKPLGFHKVYRSKTRNLGKNQYREAGPARGA
eukprot:5324290-Karenia_brevis.AAC.1